jgi:DMSO/TMAO reductase YedYZ molybdopterin-dependent catalytic subunit
MLAPKFAMDQNKTQEEPVLAPADAPEGVIVSPDTRRANRVPPGQSRTKKWPILDTSGPPPISIERWKFSISGLVARPMEWNWREFQELERVKVFSDFHCVTRWSRLGNTWEGVSTRKLIDLAGGAVPEAQYAIARGYDTGFTTNLPLSDFLAEDALVAFLHDGEPLTAEHGGPARLIIPQLYAWKSAKWIAGLELVDRDKAGFWERNGYHMHGDPWKEERFGW